MAVVSEASSNASCARRESQHGQQGPPGCWGRQGQRPFLPATAALATAFAPTTERAVVTPYGIAGGLGTVAFAGGLAIHRTVAFSAISAKRLAPAGVVIKTAVVAVIVIHDLPPIAVAQQGHIQRALVAAGAGGVATIAMGRTARHKFFLLQRYLCAGRALFSALP